MTRLVFVDVDDTLLTPPYEAVRRVATFFGKKFPEPEAFLKRSKVDYDKAFPELFSSAAEMWAIALLSLPFGHFRSQAAMPFDVARVSEILTDNRLYLLSKNPPSFTRWRVQRLHQLFKARLGDRYIACGPILRKGESKLSIITKVAADRGVALSDCLLVDDSVDNLKDAAAAGVSCALVRATWNADEAQALQQTYPALHVIDSPGIPEVIVSHLSGAVDADRVSHFFVPPLSPGNAARMAWVFAKRWWLYAEPLPRPEQIVPIARNPLTSYLYKDPQAATRKRMRELLARPGALAGCRVLPLRRGARPSLLPLTLAKKLEARGEDEKVRLVRTVCRDLLRTRGHRFVRDPMFYFTELNREAEKKRILAAPRIKQAKKDYAHTHRAAAQDVDALAERYVEELLTCRSYVSCLFGEWLLDTILSKIFKRINLKTHPAVRKLEDDHFLFYAATHRSYLDSAVLWSILSHNGLSFPFAVGADKMRTVWFGRLGARGGTFFLRRKFIDGIYAAIIAEHVSSMQQPGSVIEVFLEGQRSRSGLTLAPKKGIASIVYDNMGPHDKVAIVPVSFVYNKLPESEKLIKERFDERKKLGAVSLREVADMKVRASRRKTTYEKVRAAWRRIKSAKVSECHVQFAEPIVLQKGDGKASLQDQLNETMLRINTATAILPSSVLCLALLGADEGHATFDFAVEFLRFSKDMVHLYQLPDHLPPKLLSGDPEADVRRFMELPFVNRKFKRARMKEREIISIDALDVERASYYKNNVFHFYVLPAILSYVLTDVHSGRVEELHRCFDHMFAKLQVKYFLPRVASTRSFIDAFLQLLAKQGIIAVVDHQWVVNDEKKNAMLLRVLSRMGADLVQNDLPNLLDVIRRSTSRRDVHVPSRLRALHTTTHPQAKVVGRPTGGFYVQCDATAKLGDRVEFTPVGASCPVGGVIVEVDVGGVAVRPDPTATAGSARDGEAGAGKPLVGASDLLVGSATFRREQAGTGVITNLSPSGAFITTDLQLQAGNRLSCSLGQQDAALVVHGRVARITEAGVGVHFEGLSEEDKARLVLLSVGTARPAK